MMAIQCGHAEVVKLLVANGANVNHADNNDFNALRMASQEGHVEVVQLLLVNGATEGVSQARAIAKQQGHITIVDILTHLTQINIVIKS